MLKKIAFITIIATSSLISGEFDQIALTAETNKIRANKNIYLEKLEIMYSKKVDESWYGYAFNVEFIQGNQKKQVVDMMFTDGKRIANNLYSTGNGNSYKDLMSPTLDKKYYDEKYFVAGNKNAKNKVLIFSDPLCPFCKDYMPSLIKDVKENNQQLALYYIPFPLERLHPTSKTLIKLSHLAREDGIKDVELKLYQHKFSYPANAKDELRALKEFNSIFNKKYTMDSINSEKVDAFMSESKRLIKSALVQGTPVVFFNGELDNSRVLYKKHIK